MLGIDIGSYSVKAAVVKKSGRGVAKIDQIACQVLPENFRGVSVEEPVLQKIVADLVKKVGRGQSRVAFSVPTASVILKKIEVDADLDDALLEGEVQIELVNFIPFPLEQVYADYVKLGVSASDRRKQTLFVAASRRDVVDKIAYSVNAKSIRKKEVDVEAFVIGQVLEQIKGKGYREAYGVIDIGYQKTTVSIFKAGDMLFNREHSVGGHHLTESIADLMGATIAEAEETKHNNIHTVSATLLDGYFDSISDQIGLALEFFASTNNQKVDTFYLTGGGSFVSGLTESLNKNLKGYHFKPLPIGQEIGIGKATNGMTKEEVQYFSAVVAGLSMRK